jgi:ribosomal protein S18 acetylase RimI-like enzyme
MAAVVRPFHANDGRACGAIVGATPLRQRAGLGAERAATILTTAAERGETVLVLDDRGPAGFAWIDARRVRAERAYLRMIAVAPDRRSSGLGARLMDAFETIAATEDGHAFLMVSDSNADAQRFYRRRGYVEVGRVPGYVSPDVVEIVLWKRVGGPSRP